MSGTAPEIPEELQVLAGEYVIGALDSAEMRAVRRRAAEDRLLAAAIREWEERLAPLAAAVPEMPPPEALWSRIERALALLPQEPAEPVPLHAPAERLVPSARMPRPAESRARRVWPWQLATAASLALAAGLAALALLPQTPPRPMGVAALAPFGAAPPAFMVEARPDGRMVVRAMGKVPVPAGRDLELWILPKGAATPASLGVLPPTGGEMEMKTPPGEGAQLMVSVEPQGGSPTGAPTGPVLYSGTLGTLSL